MFEFIELFINFLFFLLEN